MAVAADTAAAGAAAEQERRERAEQEVGPLLARANLLRMRGQWDEAIAASTDALRHAPQSATAHSLLGDIYEAQGRLEDAAQWFGMAVELDPANLRDREKLDRVTAAVAAAAQQAAAAALSRAPGGAAASAAGGGATTTRRAREKTQEWFDHIFPPGRSEGIARLILALSGLVALVLLAAAAFVVLKYSSDPGAATAAMPGSNGTLPAAAGGLPASQPSPASPSGPVRVVATPTAPVTPQNTPPATTVKSATPPPASQQPGVNSPDSRRSGVTTGGAVVTAAPASTDADAALMVVLARSLPPGITATAARMDPRTAQVSLDITVSAAAGAAGQGESIAATRERILRAAAFSARVAALADVKLQRVSVRVSRRTSPSAATASLAFVADAMANGLRAADPVTGSADELLLLFSNPWWSPELAAVPAANP